MLYCCNCQTAFTNLGELEEHSYQEYLSAAGTERADLDICGCDIFLCYGCLGYFRGFSAYLGHFRAD